MVLLHGLLYELHVLRDVLGVALFHAGIAHVNTSFCFLDEAEALIDLVDEAHELLQFLCLVGIDGLEGVDGSLGRTFCILFFLLAGYHCHGNNSQVK